MPMAADQRKRRLSVTSTLGHGLTLEQSRAKKRDLRSNQYDFNFNSHISLKWDDNGKRVVAKEDQIGISWRQLCSFVPTPPCSNTKLADILTVPRDVFQLHDLTGVLSYKVWDSTLTEKERGYLSQFLPRGMDPDLSVQALFGGDNFYFGNPFLDWGAKLCSGDLHPDAIVNYEKSFKTNKKNYYSELQQYHNDMIMNLQMLKERCMRSKDFDTEILQMSRSRTHAEKSILPDANGVRSIKHEDSVAALSESLSSIPDEKLSNSDNQKLSAIRDAEIQKRMRTEEIMKDKHEKLVLNNSVKVLRKLKKADKLQKAIYPNDGAKYMSYVKISKKQHELVKSMKQSGSSIQSRTLNRVLGNLNSFNVKPYEMFVEEEQKRIHAHWSNLANNDIAAAFQNWRSRQSEKEQILSSLLHEMEAKVGFMTEDKRLDNYDSHSETQDEKSDDYGFRIQAQDDNLDNPDDEENMEREETDGESSQRASEQEEDESVTGGSNSDNDRDSDPSSRSDRPLIQNPLLKVNQDFDHPAVEHQSSMQNNPLSIERDIHISSLKNQSSMHNPTLNVNEEFSPMDLNAENNNVTKETSETCSRTPPSLEVASQSCEASLDASHLQSHSSAPDTEGMACSSVKNVWASIGSPESYHHPPPTTQYTSSCEQSFRHPQFVPNQPASLINLESDLRENDTTKDLLNRHHPDHMPFFNSYTNRDRSELLQSLIKRDSYQEQKKTGLEFHPTSSVLLEPTQFTGHFQEQMQPSFALDNRSKAQSELFMNHHNIQEGIYSDNRYPIQGQEHFPTLNMRDWTNTCLPTPIQSSQLSSGEPVNHNWFASENRAHGSWSTSDSTVFSTPSLGSGSSCDQSLYSVLTQCGTLCSQAPYSSVVSTEQIIRPANYEQDMHGEIRMTSNSAVPQTASPFDYLSGNEAAAATTMKNTNMGWMSLGHQTSGLRDQSERPFFKPWNQ